jgi:carboxyl-terminal processing protease
MLASLDPYTEFIGESDVENYQRTHVSNEYGGIGALVQQQEGHVVIAEPYYGYPAQKADIRAGDVVISIDDKDLSNKKVDEISNLLKGSRSTPLKLILQRKGETLPIVKTIMREEIKIKNVSYVGLINEDIGYIKLDKFLDNCAAEVKEALVKLKEKNHIKGLVFDLRGNGGGILQEAVKIVNLFVPKGTLVVTQKGKIKSNDAQYYATSNPVDTEIPLIVLVDNGSASASEIVTGAIQETDRGIIIGERTYGKGLVQQTLSLAYNSLLKVTIAKYYTPSGRCIQALDYTHRNKDGSVIKVADSLITEFKTKNNRSVYDGSGIFPDINTVQPNFHLVSANLVQNFHIFDFATNYRAAHQTIAPAKTFALSEQDYQSFIDLVQKSNFKYKTGSESKLEELEKASVKENYYESVKIDYDKLREKINAIKKNDLITFKPEIKELLESEIISRYYFQDGRIESTFDDDVDIKEAVKTLKDKVLYSAILAGEGKYKTIGKPDKVALDTAIKIATPDGGDDDE